VFVERAGGPKALAALEVAAKMGTWAKSQGIQIIHGLNDINTTLYPTCKDADKFAGFVAALKSSGGEEPPKLLEGGGDDVTFTRRPGHVSALKSPGLEYFLQKKGIKSQVLAGLSTSGCVLSSAMSKDAEVSISDVVLIRSNACMM
jgi:nicotinamidase-related amidase